MMFMTEPMVSGFLDEFEKISSIKGLSARVKSMGSSIASRARTLEQEAAAAAKPRSRESSENMQDLLQNVLQGSRRSLSPDDITPAMRRMAEEQGHNIDDLVQVQGGPLPFLLRPGLLQPHYNPLGQKITATESSVPKGINTLLERTGLKTRLPEGPSEAITMHEMGHASGRLAKERPILNQAEAVASRGVAPLAARMMAQHGTSTGSLRAAKGVQGVAAASTLGEEGRATVLALRTIAQEYGTRSPQFIKAVSQLGPAYGTYVAGEVGAMRNLPKLRQAAQEAREGGVLSEVKRRLKEQSGRG